MPHLTFMIKDLYALLIIMVKQHLGWQVVKNCSGRWFINSLVMNVCCPGSTMMERAPHWHQDNSHTSSVADWKLICSNAPWPMRKQKAKKTIPYCFCFREAVRHNWWSWWTNTFNVWAESLWLNALIVNCFK